MTLQQFNNLHIEISNPTFKTYRIMYKFGAWVSKETIAAESDMEAVFDADQIIKGSNLQGGEHGVALFCGNRLVKSYR
jgi:hypothetical protein